MKKRRRASLSQAEGGAGNAPGVQFSRATKGSWARRRPGACLRETSRGEEDVRVCSSRNNIQVDNCDV